MIQLGQWIDLDRGIEIKGRHAVILKSFLRLEISNTGFLTESNTPIYLNLLLQVLIFILKCTNSSVYENGLVVFSVRVYWWKEQMWNTKKNIWLGCVKLLIFSMYLTQWWIICVFADITADIWTYQYHALIISCISIHYTSFLILLSL